MARLNNFFFKNLDYRNPSLRLKIKAGAYKGVG